MKKKKTRPPLNKRKPIIDKSRDRKMLGTTKGAPGTNRRVPRTRPEAPLQNGKELKPIMIKPNMGRVIKPMAKFPDLSGDGEVTKKDILMGRGVINKPKMKFDGDKKLQQQLQNAVVLDGVEFGLSAEDVKTAKAIDQLQDAQRRRKEKGGLKGAAESRARFDKVRKSLQGTNIAGDLRSAGPNDGVAFRLKKQLNIPGMGKKQGGDRLIMDAKGNIKNVGGDAVTPYLEKIGVQIRPKMQNGKTLKELEAEINRIGKDAIKSTNPNERDAALMKKRILMKERDAMIAANKKKSKTNKTNPTMKKPKMYNKPKMDHGKKPKMYNKPKYYGKKKK